MFIKKTGYLYDSKRCWDNNSCKKTIQGKFYIYKGQAFALYVQIWTENIFLCASSWSLVKKIKLFQSIIYFKVKLMLYKQMSIKQSRKRENNWKKYPYLYNQHKNMTFQCQCGKKYVSFPGLYLHFQRKHHQKISTKPDGNECEITQAESGMNYKYFICAKREYKNQFPGKCQFQSDSLARILKQYSNFCLLTSSSGSDTQNSEAKFCLYQNYLVKFQRYVRSLSGEKQGRIVDHMVQNIPYCFNGFILSLRKTEMLQEETEKALCFFLMNFWKWLNEKGFTTLIIQYTDCEAPKVTSSGLNQ